jgi:thiol-disulfide isomerase/thioredoxin
MRIIKLLPVLIIALAVSISAYSQKADPDNHLALGDELPDFEYQTADGKTLKSEDLFGKVVLVNFYASWCGPCKKELPFVESDLYKKYKDNEDFCLLVIARQEGWDKINEFKKNSELDLPYYPDPKRDIYNLFAGKYIPRNYLFDKQGRLVLFSKGYKVEEFEELKKEIIDLL